MRHRSLFSLLVAAVLAATTLSAAAVTGETDDATGQAGSTSEWMVVTFRDAPAASYEGGVPGLARTKPAPGARLNPHSADVRAYQAHLRGSQRAYTDWLARNAPQAQVEEDLTLVANAVVVRRNGANPATIGRGPGVVHAEPAALYRPAMNRSTELVGADDVWPLVGGRADAGEGVRIGIIDSGIDFSHRFFACKGDPPPAKVYFSGDGLADPDNTIVSDHGTHVAGTAAGCLITLGVDEPVSGEISGLAPGAELWDYNVFPGYGAGYVAFGGSAFSHDIIRALEDAVVDGMDVVNMSLGGTPQGPHDVLAEAVDAAVDAGVVVAVAAGNSGPGDATIESPGTAPGALTAGASTNPHFIGIGVDYTTSGGHSRQIGAALGDFAPFDPSVTAEYSTTEPALGCEPISTDLTGKIALIDRGVCSFTTKIRNAENAGAVGVLIVNNVAGDPTGMSHDDTNPFPSIPAAMVGVAEGAEMKPTGTVTVDGTSPAEIVSDNADIIAGFSSRGPTPFTGLIKPDLTAPGVNIYSSVFDDEFAMNQGTSMASPHLAGAAAVLLALHPEWSPDDVKSAMVTTAARTVTDHQTGSDAVGVLHRGGGRLDLAAAAEAPMTFAPASVSFGAWRGNRAVAATTTVEVAGAAGTCDVAVDGPEIVTVSPASVGDGDAITVTLSAGRGMPSGDYEGDVVVTCGDDVLRLPWHVRIAR